MANGQVSKKYPKGVLVRELGFTTVKGQNGEVIATVPVLGKAGIINMDVSQVEVGQTLTGLRFTDEKLLTGEGIRKSQNREPLTEADYIPGLCRVIGS